MARPPLVVLCAILAALLAGCGGAPPASDADDVPVRVDRVFIDSHDAPVVVLEEQNGPRWLPIWIGTAEARSIALQIAEHTSPRPNSHDLTRDLIRGLDGAVDRVVVTELRAGTYYAVLGIVRDGKTVEIDARPSDAIAIALRDGAPIFVRASLFEDVASDEDAEIALPEREI
ncbi:MAG: bifunctional nuclease family protein [Myxococcota bacterium]